MIKEKKQTELEIEALADVFNIATSGFKEFQKNTKESSSGYYSTAASSGNYSTAASSGYSSKAASSGDYSGCTAIGYRAAVKGDMGNLLMASEYIIKDGKTIPIGGKADIVDGVKIKANCWYIVENAKWVQVDFTDGIFLRVISNKKGVKKVKTDNGQILFIVSDEEGNSAHGDTIKEARADLVFKSMSKDTSQFKNMPEDTIKTPQEWALIYRTITGSCQAGVKSFMESKGKLKKKYTLPQILEETKGAYGYDKFKSVVQNG